MEKDKIAILDNQRKNIKDKMNDPISLISERGFKSSGYVEIIDKKTGENLVDKSNLIVYDGREIALERILKKPRIPTEDNTELFVSWLSIGDGGATVSDPLTPIPPTPDDTSLANEVIINTLDPDMSDGGKKAPIYTDNITFYPDAENNGRYLIAKCTVTLTSADGNDNDINEAALWYSDSRDPSVVSKYKLWARVTFSTLRKTSERELVLMWYLYF